MSKFKNIIFNSKRYSFSYGIDGMSVLEIEDYYSGDSVKLDLSVLLDYPEVLEEMINKVKEYEIEEE